MLAVRRALRRQGRARQRPSCCRCWCTSWTSRNWTRARAPSASSSHPPGEYLTLCVFCRYCSADALPYPAHLRGQACICVLSVKCARCMLVGCSTSDAPRQGMLRWRAIPEGLDAMHLAGRELAEQIHKECRRFGKAYQLRMCAAFGGLSKLDQFRDLKASSEARCSSQPTSSRSSSAAITSACMLSCFWQMSCRDCLTKHSGRLAFLCSTGGGMRPQR